MRASRGVPPLRSGPRHRNSRPLSPSAAGCFLFGCALGQNAVRARVLAGRAATPGLVRLRRACLRGQLSRELRGLVGGQARVRFLQGRRDRLYEIALAYALGLRDRGQALAALQRRDQVCGRDTQ